MPGSEGFTDKERRHSIGGAQCESEERRAQVSEWPCETEGVADEAGGDTGRGAGAQGDAGASARRDAAGGPAGSGEGRRMGGGARPLAGRPKGILGRGGGGNRLDQAMGRDPRRVQSAVLSLVQGRRAQYLLQ